MSQVSLFRKWRSKAFADLVGQEAVVKTLRNVLSGGSPARAYLFCGPRGTGKTSTARIFAKALCCENGPGLEPCNQCSTCREITQGNCLDVFEIDAASNTQVDKIRDFIVDKVHFAPARARYKVYIIDEVHKLSSSSFNALLKTLEEPPAHVVFILATTHPHELLPTILSRCQRYDFRAFSLLELEHHLGHVAQEEGLELEPNAAQLLARSAQGSMRDGLVLLEQAQQFCGSRITETEVVQMLGLLPQETLSQWVHSLSGGDAATLLAAVEDMHRGGQDFVRVVDLWVDHLRLLMLSKVKATEAGLGELSEAYRNSLQEQVTGLSLGQILQWLKAAVELQQAVKEGQPPRIALELMLVSLCTPEASTSLESLARQVAELQRRLDEGGSTLSARPEPFKQQPGPTRSEPFKVPPAIRQEAPAAAPPPREEKKPLTTRSEPFQVPPLPRQEERPASPTPPEPVPAASPRQEQRPAAPSSKPAPSAEPFQVPKEFRTSAEGAPPEPPARRPEPKTQPAPPAAPAKPVVATADGMDPKKFWPTFLEQIRQRDKRLLGILNDVRLRELTPERVAVSVPANYSFHREFLAKSTRLLEEVSGALLQSKPRFEVIVDGGQVQPPPEQEHDSLVKKAHGLFGGRILDAAKEGTSD